MKTGYFSKKGDEYIIENYIQKRPLLNYFWNDKFLAGVNHLGGGVGGYRGQTTFYMGTYGKPRAQLINNGNRYFYIRDEETNEIWNPGWYPTRCPLDSFKSIHGIGYSKISGEKNEISATLTGTVSIDETCEVWEISLTNNSDKEKEVTVFPFVEFSLEGYVHASEYDSWVRAYYFEDNNMIFADNSAEERPHPWYHGFCATDAKVYSFDTSKDSFLGTYGAIACPDSIVSGGLNNTLAACERMVGAFETRFNLKAGETKVWHFTVGVADSLETAKRITGKVLEKGYFEKNMLAMQERKNNLVSKFTVETPDEKLNNLTNFWLKQQVQLCAEVGRGAGKGFRDQLQDSWAIAAFNPEMAKHKIYETLEQIYRSGRCVRGWLPLKERNCSDSPTWISPTISAYLKETGDYAFLDQKVKYLDEGEDTVWEHMLTAVRHSSDDTGERGLILAHEGDWNDSLNGIGRDGKGESVWTSIALYNSLLKTAEIAKEIKKDLKIYDEMLMRAERIKNAINDKAWDGEWYLAGYSDKGNKVGSHTEKEGKIYLNSQVWAAMVGVAEGERAEKCMAAVDKYLDSDYGFLTLYPPYNSYNPEIGRLTGFVPGIWENGTPYCHGVAFKIICDCVLGRGDNAYETLLKITPDSKLNPSSYSGCEPYAFTNMYFGPSNPRKGQTAFSWITGTAGWVYRSVSQYMIGFHPDFNGFTIDPCLPSSWKELKGTRKFRNDTYNISITNPEGKCKGIKKLFVDGKEYENNHIVLFGDGKTHEIRVEM